MDKLLEVQDLSVSFSSPLGEVRAVRNVSFSLKEGEILAIVGESGCGKSVLCKALMRLLPQNSCITSKAIFLQGTDISTIKEREARKLRQTVFSMIFQDPLTALNPAISVGKQIGETIKRKDRRLSRKEVKSETLSLMNAAGIAEAEKRYYAYPHQFSGGMRQRIVLAVALASNPRILLADEPTTALDVTVQAQILDLLVGLQKKKNMSVILVSHDLGVVAQTAHRIAIMYAGKIVEIGTAEEIFYDPRHPYTWGLLRSLPALNKGKETLFAIPGTPPPLNDLPKGDPFALRNEYALAIDYQKEPPLFPISETHFAASWLVDPRAPKVIPPIGGMLK